MVVQQFFYLKYAPWYIAIVRYLFENPISISDFTKYPYIVKNLCQRIALILFMITLGLKR